MDLKELREKILPAADDEFAQGMGDYADLAALKVGHRRAAPPQRPRPGPPRVLGQDHRVRGRQRHRRPSRRPGGPGGRGDARRVPDDARPPGHRGARLPQGHGPDRGGPPRRVPARGPSSARRSCWSCPRSPMPRASRSPRARSRRRSSIARARYEDPKTVRYFESERGRNFIRSTLRRTRTVESLVDRWLAAHPEHPALPHLEDDAPSAIDAPEAEASRRHRCHGPRRHPRRRGYSPAPDPDARSNPGEASHARPDGHRVHQPW